MQSMQGVVPLILSVLEILRGCYENGSVLTASS